jgi:hypothetical protein
MHVCVRTCMCMYVYVCVKHNTGLIWHIMCVCARGHVCVCVHEILGGWLSIHITITLVQSETYRGLIVLPAAHRPDLDRLIDNLTTTITHIICGTLIVKYVCKCTQHSCASIHYTEYGICDMTHIDASPQQCCIILQEYNV